MRRQTQKKEETQLIPRIISIRQLWAWAITVPPQHLAKDVENRDWQTSYRGPILIHAGGKIERHPAIVEYIEAATGMKVPADPPHNGIVGRSHIIDCVAHHKSHWFRGKYGFVLKDSAPVDFIPCKGRLGLYYPDADLLKILKKKGVI